MGNLCERQTCKLHAVNPKACRSEVAELPNDLPWHPFEILFNWGVIGALYLVDGWMDGKWTDYISS